MHTSKSKPDRAQASMAPRADRAACHAGMGCASCARGAHAAAVGSTPRHAPTARRMLGFWACSGAVTLARGRFGLQSAGGKHLWAVGSSAGQCSGSVSTDARESTDASHAVALGTRRAGNGTGGYGRRHSAADALLPDSTTRMREIVRMQRRGVESDGAGFAGRSRAGDALAGTSQFRAPLTLRLQLLRYDTGSVMSRLMRASVRQRAPHIAAV
jgi:hypothetical protein